MRLSLDALRDAVTASPYDDAPRLAYADAIEATDPAYAEFIRLELEQRRTGEGMTGRRMVLLDQNRTRFMEHLLPLIDGGTYNRGFVEHVFIDAARLLKQAPELYRLAPVLHLDLTGVKPVVAELFDSPHLERIVSLGLLRNGLDDADMKIIAGSKRLRSLEYLDLALNQVSDAGVELLAASTSLPRLEWVGLRTNPCTDPVPTHCDEYDADTLAGTALMEKHGHRAWLSARPVRAQWPPNRYLLGAKAPGRRD